MEVKDAVLLILMFIVFGAPALALAARLAIRPVLDAMDRLREGMSVRPRTADPRIDHLEAEVKRLAKEVEQLAEAEAFHRQMLERPSDQAQQLPG